MAAHPQPSIWTLEIDGKPTLAFEAKKYREAYELCHEDWLRAELGLQKLHGVPLCGADSHLKIRLAPRAGKVPYPQTAEANKSPNQNKIGYFIEVDDVTALIHSSRQLWERCLS